MLFTGTYPSNDCSTYLIDDHEDIGAMMITHTIGIDKDTWILEKTIIKIVLKMHLGYI